MLKTQIKKITTLSILTTSLILATNVFAQNNIENKNKIISVTGNGQQSVEADIAGSTINIEAQALTSEAAQRDAAKRSSDIMAFLRSKNVEKLKTAGINLYPRYDYENNKQKLIGYTASNHIAFQIKTTKLGTLLDEVVKLGATRIENVKFSANQTAFEQAKNQAIIKAVNDAQNKAQVTLNALNLKAKEVVMIRVDNTNRQINQNFGEMRMLKASNDTPTPVEGGEENIEANVSLEISY